MKRILKQELESLLANMLSRNLGSRTGWILDYCLRERGISFNTSIITHNKQKILFDVNASLVC